jgi:hypothetical protein
MKWMALLTVGASLLAGQETQPSPELPADASPSAIPDPSLAPALEPEDGRILGVIPNNKTMPPFVPANRPLAPRQKFNLAFKDTTDPFTFLLAGFYAGISQWQDDFPSFGEGGAGYGKRFGAAYADQAVGNYLTEAIFPCLLHEDPRYFRKGIGSKWQRIRYALTRTLVTRSDAGRNTFNFSEILGNATAAGVSALYYPAASRTAEETGEKFAVQVVSDSAFNILLEFWPDMRHALLRR